MNHIYKTVWNAAMGTWTAVQETAKSHGKSSSSKAGRAGEQTVGVRFAFTLMASALLLASGQVMAVTGTESAGKQVCFYDEASHSVVCGDASTQTVDRVDGKTAKSVVIGQGASNAGESNVAIGIKSSSAETASVAIGSEAKALHNQSIAIGQNAEARADWDISIGRFAGHGIQNPEPEGRNIAIGDGALKDATNPNNTTAIGTSAGAGSTGDFNVVIGTYANSTTVRPAGVAASNVVAIGDRALAAADSAVAIGNRVKATGAIATAVGASADASGPYAISNGYGATSSGSHSIAIGSAQNQTNKTQATQSFAIAIGSNQTAATANSAIAVGTEAKASGSKSIAVGAAAKAQVEDSIAIGRGVTTELLAGDGVGNREGMIAIGSERTKATGKAAVAIGRNSQGIGRGTVALGDDAQSTTGQAIAVGAGVRSSGAGSVSIGSASQSNADRAVSLGVESNSTAYRSVALGAQSEAARAALTPNAVTSNVATAAGNQVYALDQATQTDKDAISATVKGGLGAVSVGNATNTRQIINVAAGSEDSDAVNVAQLKAVANQINQAAGTHYYSVKDEVGDATVPNSNYNNDGATGSRSLAAGIESKATATNATAVGGKHAKATAVQALALGADTLASGTSSIAIGGDDLDNLKPDSVRYYNTLTGETITARQYQDTTANADAAIAVGVQTQATGDLSTAVGVKSEASGLASVALGVGAKGQAEGGVALGAGAAVQPTGRAAVALGSKAVASADTALALGPLSQADKDLAVALGALSSTASNATQETTATVGSITYSGFAGAGSVDAGRQVSVGRAGLERQIKNVAPGAINATSTDAINGSQLHATQTVIGNLASSTARNFGGGAAVQPDGSISAPTYTINGTAYNDVGSALQAAANAGGGAGAGTHYYSVKSTDNNPNSNFNNDGAKAIDSVAAGVRVEALRTNGVAIGVDVAAAGEESLAIGNNVIAGALLPKANPNESDKVDPAVNVKGATAVGNNSRATAVGAQAFGQSSKATALNAAAIGRLATASGERASAFGVGNTASGASSFAGGDKSEASGINSTAIGLNAKAQGGNSIAVGNNATATTTETIAIGRDTQATKTGAIAMGQNSQSQGISSTAVGLGTQATGNQSAAFGATAEATADQAMAIGYHTAASAQYSTALGNTANASGIHASALGSGATAIGGNSIAVGSGTATGGSSIAVGRVSKSYTGNDIAIGSESEAGVKDGTSSSNAIAVGRGSKATQVSTVAIGNGAKAEASNSVALGTNASVNNAGAGSIAVGSRSSANGINATAIGQASEAAGQNAFAGGQDSHAVGKSSVAVGDGARSSEDSASAVGAYTKATGAGAGAFGFSANASAYHGLALGANSVASAGSSVAIGSGANASLGHGVALGSLSKTEVNAGAEGADPLSAGGDKNNPTWTSTRAAVSVGDVAGGITRQITGVAAGTNPTDAVNVAQLNTVANHTKNVGDTIKNILGGDADITPQGNLSMNNIGDTGKANIHEAIKAAYDQSNSPLTFVGNEGSSARKLGQNVTISGGLETTAPSSNKNVHTFVDNATGKVDIRLANAPVFEGKVSAQGLDAGGQKITGVAKGTENNDAVNWEQLRDAIANVNIANSTEVKANSPFSYINSAGKQLVRKPDGTFVEADNPNTPYNGSDITIAALNPNAPQATTPTRVGNVDKGIKDNDAVNVSQLKDVATALGGGAEVNPATGALTAPSYSITKTDGSSYPVANNVGQALQDLNAEVIKPMRFTGDTGTDATRKLGEKLTVKGGATGTLTENNIGVEANGTDTLTVKLAEAINLGNNGSVQTGNTTVNNDGVTITGGATGPVSLTNTGLNNGGNKITNVANGTDPNDAVNFSQLQALSSAAKTHYYSVNDAGAQGGNYDNNGATGGNALAAGVGAQATGISSTAVGHNAKATNSAAVAIGWQAEASGDHSIALGGASQGATGDLKTMAKGNSSMAIGFGAEVKEGADWSLALGDLAKVGQNAERSVAIGVQSAVEDGVTGAVALGHGARVAHKDSVALGSGSVTTAVDNAGRDTATVGDITYSGFAATAPASMVSVGTAGAERTITNVAAGRIDANSTDAINGSQLHATQTVIGNVAGSVKKILGGDAAVDPDGTLRMTDIGGTGKDNIHEAIEAINTTAGAGWNIGDGTGAPVGSVKPGKQVDFVAGNNTTKVEVAQTASGESTVTVSTAASPLQYTGTNNAGGNNAPNADQFTPTDQVTLVGSGGDTQSGVTINNVAPGSLAINSKQAVNGGQLGAVADSVRAALGGTSSLDPVTGQVTAGLDVGGNTYNNVQDALRAINTTASGGWNLRANGGPVSNIAGPNNTVNVIDGRNTKVSLNGNELKVDVVDNPTFSGPVTANGGLTAAGNLTAAPGTNVDMGNNVIHNVADGVADTDAVNVRQMRAMSGNITNITNQINAVDARVTQVDNRVTQVDNRVTNLSNRVDGIDGKIKDADKRVTDVANLVGENLTNPDGTKGLTVYDVAGQTRTDHTNVISALNQVKNEGTKYSHTRDNGEAPIIGPTNDSSAGALGSTAQGVNAIVEPDAENATAMGRRARVRNAAARSVAIGNEAVTGGASAVAVGDGAQALGEKSISIGTGNVVHAARSGAIGDPTMIIATATDSYSIGNNNTVNTADTFVMGNNVVTSVANSVYLGAGAAATAAPTAQTAGMASYNAQVVDGVTHHYAGGTPVGVVSVGDVGQERRVQNVAAGLVSPTSTDAINGSQLYQTNAAIGNLNNRININHDKAMGGIASAMASAGLPQAYLPGKSMIAMGVGAYQGRSAVAVGVSTISDNGRWIIKGSVNANNKGNVGATLGAGYQW